jgi:hypothetical protein
VFRRMNKDRRSVSAVTVFNAECIEGLPHTLEIRAAVEAAGFFVSRKSSWPNIRCVAELRRTHSRLGSAGVSESLGIIKEVWPNEEGGLKAPIIGGVSVVLAVTGVSVPRMVKTLKTVSPEFIVRQSRSDAAHSKHRGTAAADVMLLAYNKRLKNKLVR